MLSILVVAKFRNSTQADLSKKGSYCSRNWEAGPRGTDDHWQCQTHTLPIYCQMERKLLLPPGCSEVWGPMMLVGENGPGLPSPIEGCSVLIGQAWVTHLR